MPIGLGPAFAAPAPPSAPSPPQSLQELYRRSSPAVVAISQADGSGKTTSLASGFLVSPDGVIVTNHNVIDPDPGAMQIKVKLPRGDVFTNVRVVYAEARRDFAVITITATGLPSLPVGDSDKVEVGEHVVAIGNPKGLELTMTDGIVGNIRVDPRIGYRFIQHQAPISPGSSGGPLLDLKGQVIGINAFRFKDAQNLNGAIPINYVKPYFGEPAKMTWQEWARVAGAAPPRPAPASPPAGRAVPEPHTFFETASHYRGLGEDFHLGFAAGVFDATSLFAKAAESGGVSSVATTALFNCLDGKGDRLGDLRTWISTVAQDAPAADPVASVVSRACQRAFSSATFYEHVSDYQSLADDFKLGFAAGLYDAVAEFAALAETQAGVDRETALGVFQCFTAPGDTLSSLQTWISNATRGTPDRDAMIHALVTTCSR